MMYDKQNEKNAITGEALGDAEDKFPGAITYEKPASPLSKNIVIVVEDNFNVSGYLEDSNDEYDDTTPTYEIFESQYSKNNGIYYYEPDLSGFKPEATYYVTYDENGNSEKIYGRIDKVEKPTSGWHDYKNKLWANVVTVTESDVTYWTWIPRYEYTADNKSASAYFVDMNNECTMEVDGADQKIDVSACTLPESFKFSDENLKGYWISKYEIQLSEKSDLEQMRARIYGQSIEVGTTNSNGLYTIYLNGNKIAEHQKLDEYYKIDKLKPTKIYDVCVYSETNARMVGRKKKMVNSIIQVDTSGFNKANTYYVVYDKNGQESIAGRMDKIPEPVGWYNYEEKIWANLVTVNEDDVTYWTYIPRYQYSSDEIYTNINMVDVEFIPTSQIAPSVGCEIPESFTFNGIQLTGYWISKYEVQLSERSDLEQLKLTNQNDKINITSTNPSGKYTIYLNGEKSITGVSLPCTIKTDLDYDICVYSEENNRMVGARKKQLSSDYIIKVDASGFNPDCTYYVTYDEKGTNEQVGEKIKIDSNGNLTNMPENWYDYDNKKWANLVTKGKDESGNELVTYWTYIPRYEYDTQNPYTNGSTNAEVRFISKEKITADFGFEIPESFNFNGIQLPGYWISKYEVQGTID